MFRISPKIADFGIIIDVLLRDNIVFDRVMFNLSVHIINFDMRIAS